MRLLRPLLIAACLFLPREAFSQAKLAGQWAVRYTRAYVNLHSGDTTFVEETAQMVLHPRGDSVFGFWQTPASPGDPTPAYRTVRGMVSGDAARVQVDQAPHDNDGFFDELGRDIVEFLKTHIHNMPSTIPLLEFSVRGDSLIGTRRSMTLDGEIRSGPQRFTGVRDGSPRPD